MRKHILLYVNVVAASLVMSVCKNTTMTPSCVCAHLSALTRRRMTEIICCMKVSGFDEIMVLGFCNDMMHRGAELLREGEKNMLKNEPSHV